MDIRAGQHAFVTGGASGIGRGIVQALAARGVRVTLADVDEEGMRAVVETAPDLLRAQVLDTRDRAGWAAAKAAAEAAFGPVDILINNAGIAPDGREFAEMDPTSFDRILSINLTGVFNGISAFAADMRARGSGHIVNTASLAGITQGSSGGGAYTTAKFGVIGLSETLRVELAPYGVGVSALCPGYVPSDIARNTQRLGGLLREGGGALPPGAREADVVAGVVLDGIERNLPFILTHPEEWPHVERRHQQLQTAFEDAAAHSPV